MTVIDIKVMERLSQENTDDTNFGTKVRNLVSKLSLSGENEEICEDQDI